MDVDKRPREELHKEQCLSFVKKLWAADTLAMFHYPVSATEVPGYYEVIETPMDLSTIRKNIEQGKYTTDGEVENDVVLMLSNALEFNEKGSQWHDLAKQLKKRYLALASESGLSFDADQAFIPTKKARDDESTLRKAEKKADEKLEDILQAMEKDKDIPLEQLRAMYARRTPGNEADQQNSDYSSGRVTDDSDDEVSSAEEDTSGGGSSSGSYDTDEEDDDSLDSESASKDDDDDE
ncbi:bromodomain factor 2 protein, putative [Leishmania tarentolae]|uniref:Bromodomain factor 2 protein, putative n=1 Tax=Leishmania tarentolae TaxID=5689 RepID=A0A640L0R3_LEITA|nr:bromodomain factor 2 protein, putative [Leishmania tarentolae]